MIQIDQSVSDFERYNYRFDEKIKVSLPAIKQFLRDETTGGTIQYFCRKAGFVTQNVLYYLRKGEIPEGIFVKVFGEIPELREYMEKYEREKEAAMIEQPTVSYTSTKIEIPNTNNSVFKEIALALGNTVSVQINCTDICKNVNIITLSRVMDIYKGKGALMSVLCSDLGVEAPKLANFVKMNNIEFRVVFENSVKFIIDWTLQ